MMTDSSNDGIVDQTLVQDVILSLYHRLVLGSLVSVQNSTANQSLGHTVRHGQHPLLSNAVMKNECWSAKRKKRFEAWFSL
jgi:hypothetical protein